MGWIFWVIVLSGCQLLLIIVVYFLVDEFELCCGMVFAEFLMSVHNDLVCMCGVIFLLDLSQSSVCLPAS